MDRVVCVDHIFDLNFIMPTIATLGYRLLERQCANVMSAFNTVIKADQGHTSVQRHLSAHVHDVV
jgi:hypothetical protein